MRMFTVKTGTKVIAIPRSSYARNGYMHGKMVTTKKDANYFLEDIQIDPIKPNPNPNTVGHYYAKQGYYGFKLKSIEWDTMLVHMNDVEVI